MKKVTTSNLKDSAFSILTVYFGLMVGVFTLNKIPSNLAKYVAAAVGLGGPFLAKNKNLQILLATVGAAGVSKIVKDLTAGKTGVLSVVNSSTPTLSGTGRLGRMGNTRRLGQGIANIGIARQLTGVGNITMDSELASALS